MTEHVLEGGLALVPGEAAPVAASVRLLDDRIAAIGDIASSPGVRRFDAAGLMVLPGIVDIHGDAFERQLLPRPGVGIDPTVAFLDTDRQLLAAGITTAFHGVTWSWEPGLRGRESVVAVVDALERLRPRFGCDTRIHLRFESFNLDAVEEAADWIAGGRVDLLAFNNHLPGLRSARMSAAKIATYVQKAGVTHEHYLAVMEGLWERREEVPAAHGRLAAAARAAGVALLSHDDRDPVERESFRALGCRIAEFPTTAETARAARDAGDAVVLGAPNVLRGGSHAGLVPAQPMVAERACRILASDYYYPSLLQAAFKLAHDGVVPFAEAWGLISTNPAEAAGLRDRGRLEPGARADIIAVAPDPVPHVVAVFVGGRLVHLSEGDRLVS